MGGVRSAAVAGPGPTPVAWVREAYAKRLSCILVGRYTLVNDWHENNARKCSETERSPGKSEEGDRHSHTARPHGDDGCNLAHGRYEIDNEAVICSSKPRTCS